jgi:drug/metabolite transporter (DMT)-like permease
MNISNGLVILSEVVLSSYPLLIKLVDTSIFLQIGLRMFTFSVLAYLCLVLTNIPIRWKFVSAFYIGLLNLVHVASSYFAFKRLAAGNAVALFYTYPIFNIIGASILGEPLLYANLLWIGLALIGAIALAKPTGSWDVLGVSAGLLAALTESGIYLWFKQKEKEPWNKMIHMYGSSSIMWIIIAIVGSMYGYVQPHMFSISTSGLSAILLFNSIIGFGGTSLRFYMIPKVSTYVFSGLSFIGIVSAYLFGWLGKSEVPTTLQLVGAFAIMISNLFIKN